MPDRGYRSMINMVLVSAFAFMSTYLFGQTTGQVRINSIPERGLEYVLDHKYTMTDRQLTLTEGDHHFTFWAPEHAMLDTTVFVIGDHTITLNIRLQRPPEYIEYRETLERYHRRQRMGRVVPPIVAGGLGAWAAVTIVRFGRADAALKDLVTEYETSANPDRILEIKEQDIPAAQADHRRLRTQTYISTGLFAGSLVAIAYIRRQLIRTGPPVYQDQERIRFEGLVWVPGPGGGAWTTGLSLAIR